MMKTASAALGAALLVALGWPQGAAAQGVPQGTYLSSCSNVEVRRGTLTATCRRAGGGQQRSALAGFERCAGDIGNNNGVLQCMLQGGAQARGQVVQPRRDREPDYGPPPYYGDRQPDRFGRDRDEYRESRRERCQDLQQRAEDLRARRDWAWDPDERARLDRRLYAVRERQQEARCRPY